MAFSSSFQTALRAHQAGRLGQAASLYIEILAEEPAHYGALHLLGVLAYQFRQFQLSVLLIGRSLRAQPNAADGDRHGNMGAALLEIFQPDLAERQLKIALILDPAHPDALQNRGNLFALRDELDRAISSFTRSIAASPDFVIAHVNLASSFLAGGQFDKGWPEYDWRWKMEGFIPRSLPGEAWTGCELQNKTILIQAEQGLGDTIQFCRYLPLLADLGATTIFEVQPALFDLLSGMPGVSRLIRQGDPFPPFDYHCPLLALPKIFGTDLESIPGIAPLPSLSPKQKTENGPTVRIGIAWAGNPGHKHDHARSIPLETLLPLIGEVEASWHVLQRDLRQGDSEKLATIGGMKQDAEALSDFTSTATSIAGLDLVITVDTSIAHLAGTLGVPTWVLLPLDPDWRWLRNRSDSPWYPTLRLFRQTRSGEWADVIQEIRQNLTALR